MAKTKKERMGPIRRMVHLLELPEYILSQQSHIEIIGKAQVIVENTKGILEYDEQYVKILLQKGTLSVLGTDLQLKTFAKGTIVVQGKISAVEFM